MPRRSFPVVDPVFAEIAKAIYGDVDVREIADLAKGVSPDSSGVHVDQPIGTVPPATQQLKEQKRQQRVAATGLGATGVAMVAGLHSFQATGVENKVRRAVAAGLPVDVPKANKAVARVGRVLHVNPVKAAGVIGGSMLGLHAVEAVGDVLGARAQVKAIKANQQPGQSGQSGRSVAKGFRLKPLNAIANRVPSLRARRPKMSPLPGNPATKAGLFQPVAKGLRTTLRNAENASGHADTAAKEVSEVAGKLKRLVPSRRAAALIGGSTAVGLTGAMAGAAYAGSYAGNRRAQRKPVKKSVDVQWDGEISKVDADKHQVFGWASVSRINGEDVVDLQGDIVEIDEIEKSAYRYVLESRKGGDMHRRVAKFDDNSLPLHTADMIESFVVTPEKLEKMGLPADALPLGWWVGYHVNDEAQWQMVKSGERTGFSIHGKGTRTAVSKAHPNEVLEQGDDDHPIRVPARAKVRLRDRAGQAIRPPQVKLRRVRSTAVSSMGYQRQTRRLAYEMGSRPGRPYVYKVDPAQAREALDAPSIGHHYATEIRGKAKRAGRYSPADRARLFADPQVSKAVRRENPDTAQWAGKIPKHSEAAAFLRDTAKGPKPKLIPIARAVLAKGELTGDNPQAEQARVRRTVGLATAAGGYAVATKGKEIAEGTADTVTRSAKRIGESRRAALIASRTGHLKTLTTRGGVGLIGAGLALAGEGAVADLRHRGVFTRGREHAKDAKALVGDTLHKSAFGVDHEVAKAFDSEHARHGRQDMYAGMAAGGTVVAGSGAIAAERMARPVRAAAAAETARATGDYTKLQARLSAMGQGGASPAQAIDFKHAASLHRDAARSAGKAAEIGSRARKLTRISRGSAVGAAALGATALGLHDYDRRRGGRTYGY